MKLKIYTSIAFLAVATGINAEDENSNEAYELAPFQVVGSILSGLSDSDALTVLDRELLQNQQGSTAVNIFNYTAGVTGINEGGRQSFRINIRGLEGSGRVAIDIDGAQQNLTDHNHGFATNRVMLDTNLLKSVDVVRGPASNKKGGGALAGSVSFNTIDPVDLTRGNASGGFFSIGGEENGDGFTSTVALGRQANEQWSFLGALSYRSFGDYEDADGNEVIASGKKSETGLFKAVYQADENQTLRFSYQGNRYDYDGSGAFARGQLRSANVAAEQVDSDTFSVQYANLAKGKDWLDLQANLYLTKTERLEEDLDSDDVDLHDIETKGFNITNSAILNTESVYSRISYGLDFFEDDLVSLSDGVNPTTSDPGGQRSQYGLFINGNHQLNRYVTIFEGLRYDDFEMEDLQGVSLSGDNFSGRLGTEFHPFANSEKLNDLTLFASYGTGFRTPTLREAFISSQPSSGRRGFRAGTLPNPNLEPERSKTWEAGILRLKQNVFQEGDQLRFRAAYYEKDLVDVIGTVATDDPDFNTLDNVGDDAMYGMEFEARYDAGAYFLGFTYDRSVRELIGSGLPGDPIQNQPWSVFTTLGYNLMENRLTLGAEHRHVSAFEQTNQTNPTVIERLFRPSFDVFNIYAQFRVNENFLLNARIDNAADKLYQAYQTLDYAMGRNAKITATLKF